jgi:hypothetical protein
VQTKCWRSLAQHSPQILTSPRPRWRSSDGVALFACCHQMCRCLQPPCFNGRTLSPTVPTYCTGPPCWKRHKFWRRQNIGDRLKFTDFRQTTAVEICSQASYSGENKKWSPSLSNISFHTYILRIRSCPTDPLLWPQLLKMRCGWQGGGGPLLVPPSTCLASRWNGLPQAMCPGDNFQVYRIFIRIH